MLNSICSDVVPLISILGAEFPEEMFQISKNFLQKYIKNNYLVLSICVLTELHGIEVTRFLAILDEFFPTVFQLIDAKNDSQNVAFCELVSSMFETHSKHTFAKYNVVQIVEKVARFFLNLEEELFPEPFTTLSVVLTSFKENNLQKVRKTNFLILKILQEFSQTINHEALFQKILNVLNSPRFSDWVFKSVYFFILNWLRFDKSQIESVLVPRISDFIKGILNFGNQDAFQHISSLRVLKYLFKNFMEKMEHQIVNLIGQRLDKIELPHQIKYDLGAEMTVMKTGKKWKPSTNYKFPSYVQNMARTLMVLTLIDPVSLKPRHIECLFYKMPKDVLFQIIALVVESDQEKAEVTFRIKTATKLKKEEYKACMLYYVLHRKSL